MSSASVIWIVLIGVVSTPARGWAQDVTPGLRSIAVLAGTFAWRERIPMLSSRYRIQTAPYGAAEAELGGATHFLVGAQMDLARR